ncbi:carbohydrate ABC transporter permease [Saccharopolyspora sp. NPDC002376]
MFLGPFLILLSNALKSPEQAVYSYPPELIPTPPSTDTLERAWSAVPFGRYLANSVLIVVLTIPLYLMVSACAGHALARYRFRGQKLIFGAILSTLFLPGEVMLIPRFLVVSELGLVDTYAGLVLSSVFTASGVFLLRQAFAAIPQELVDSARIDGAGEVRMFWRILLPQVRPTLAVVAIFGFISIWNSFAWPLVMMRSEEKFPVSLGLAYLAGTFGTDARAAAAGAVIALVPVFAFFLVMQRHFLDQMSGAIKG